MTETTKPCVYFHEAGKHNTDRVIEVVVQRLAEGDIKTVVVSSTTGYTAGKFSEALQAHAWTGDRGLTLVERAPYGVIGAITPSTNPTSTIICNAIGMIAAGNAVVFNAHPGAKACSAQTVQVLFREHFCSFLVFAQERLGGIGIPETTKAYSYVANDQQSPGRDRSCTHCGKYTQQDSPVHSAFSSCSPISWSK